MTFTATHEPPLAIVHADGALTAVTAPQLRDVILKCLAHQPTAILVDASTLTIRQDLNVTAFIAAARHAAAWPGVPIVICAPNAGLRTALARLGVDLHVTVCADMERGRAAAARQELPPQVRERFPQMPSSVRAARAMATEACLRWQLPGLAEAAALVVSELVTNAVRHAQTPIELTINRARRYLHVAVRDYSRQPPRLIGPEGEAMPGGRGLLIVEAAASSWGYTLLPDGKVTWASLSRTGRSNIG